MMEKRLFMQTVKAILPIDDTLTPQNADDRGYIWRVDVAYDETEKIPPELMKDFQKLLNDGYKLGCALEPFSDQDKGLYEPLPKKQKDISGRMQK